ncbi:hypothetical protein TNCV_4046811 [Trichonephila clavipes]|nr:hypothetical protein TNCV_4046811 [Trichonephila clavipes]
MDSCVLYCNLQFMKRIRTKSFILTSLSSTSVAAVAQLLWSRTRRQSVAGKMRLTHIERSPELLHLQI